MQNRGRFWVVVPHPGASACVFLSLLIVRDLRKQRCVMALEPGVKRIAKLIVMALGVSLSSLVVAQEYQTIGNYWRREGKKDPKQLAKTSGSFQYGWCFGVQYGLSVHPQICVHTQVPVLHEMDAVLKYLDSHPETRHKSFRLLAQEALKEAFPCADVGKST